MSRRGDLARIALIEAAEQLFAERGIESVSLRDISAAAGQRNHSAAQYHFVDRAGLVAAVYEHRMRLVDERRRDLIDAIERDVPEGDRLEWLVEATIRPLVEVVDETDGWYARFLVRTRWDAFARQVLADLPASRASVVPSSSSPPNSTVRCGPGSIGSTRWPRCSSGRSPAGSGADTTGNVRTTPTRSPPT
ncbi:MAG: TetR family transcriptional regulator [Ilumatobacter sp.]|nr:TetR family transcriptional regulator [Ilumatobacter sp.]